MATFFCDEGYGLSGVDAMITCGGDDSSPFGTWTGLVPTCEGAVQINRLLLHSL